MPVSCSKWWFSDIRTDFDILIKCGPQVLGTDELNAYLTKYHLELDPHLEALVGRFVQSFSLTH